MPKRRSAYWVVPLAAALFVLVLVTAGKMRGSGSPAVTAPREASAPPEAGGAPGSRSARPAPAAPPSSPPHAEPTRATAPAKHLVRAGWGKGRGQLGRSEPAEGNAEGPTALALDASGRALVLDRANGRVVRYDDRGEVLGLVPTAVRSPQELVASRDGKLLVLDRTADRTVAVHDEQGKLVGELPLEGSGVAEAGEVTGLFVDGDSVYVESGHEGLVRIGDTSGKPDPERPSLAGRPTRDGRSLLRAELVDRATGLLRVRVLDRRTGVEQQAREVAMGTPFVQILQLDSDLRGRIFVAVHAGREASPGVWEGEEIRVACLGRALEPLGLVHLPPSPLPDESFRDLAIADDGTIAYMYRTSAGVTIDRYTCP